MTGAVVIGGPGFSGGPPTRARAERGHGGTNHREPCVRGCADTNTPASPAVGQATVRGAATSEPRRFSDPARGRTGAFAAALLNWSYV